MKQPSKSNNKRILLMGINFSPELTGIGKYTGEMADWLTDNGYDCTVVTSFPYYPNWKIQAPYTGRFYKKEVRKQGKQQIYRCPLYVPSNPSAVRRILHEASFFLSAFIMTVYLLFKQKNTYIFCIAPPFHLGFLGLFYRFLKGGKIIYHIQDLQIEAARDLRILKSESAFTFLFRMEKFILQRADYISTISSGMLTKLSKKTEQKVLLFPNWVDTSLIYPDSGKDLLKTKWGFDPKDKIVSYSGSVGEKQGLERIISIAKDLEKESSIKFIICGDGPYKEKLREMARQERLKNMHFLPLQPIHLFNDFLNITDVHLILQKKNACDLMMPSKLTGILSCGGLALVTSEIGSTLHSVIKEHNMGVTTDCENEEQLNASILACCLSDHSEQRRNARKYAEKYLDKNSILCNLFNRLEQPRGEVINHSNTNCYATN